MPAASYALWDTFDIASRIGGGEPTSSGTAGRSDSVGRRGTSQPCSFSLIQKGRPFCEPPVAGAPPVASAPPAPPPSSLASGSSAGRPPEPTEPPLPATLPPVAAPPVAAVPP